MDFHDFAEEYPLMSTVELNTLESDMRKFGFDPRFPILLFERKILDGRNRFIAAERAEVQPEYVPFEGTEEDAKRFVERANENRRHLTQEWLQRRRLERIARAAEGRTEGKSYRKIAEEEGVSEATVRDDVAKATAQGCAVEPKDGKTQGEDGKPHPAKMPKTEPLLCDRCKRDKRVGNKPVKGCKDCKELRKPKNQK